MTLPEGATGARRIGGGDINDAWHVTLVDGREAFVKSRPDAPPGEYEREARALAWLAEPGALRVARALEVSERYLALEWIDHGRLTAAGEEALGRGLARVHLAGAPHFGDPWVSCDGGDEADGRDGRDGR
ncbi:MAG: fructosamine kinase family protein, partial [Solirubrobacterales bacterium]|nr:fructosamine kinase family protein [Solirubrobacterales bacterium]